MSKTSRTTISIIVALSLFWALTYASTGEAAELTYFAKSEHFSKLPYNQTHNIIGYEFDNGVGIATFKNSYYKRSYMLQYSKHYEIIPNVRATLSGGLVSGYDGTKECLGNKELFACPMLSVGISYTKYKYTIPKISYFGGALVFSLSARF